MPATHVLVEHDGQEYLVSAMGPGVLESRVALSHELAHVEAESLVLNYGFPGTSPLPVRWEVASHIRIRDDVDPDTGEWRCFSVSAMAGSIFLETCGAEDLQEAYGLAHYLRDVHGARDTPIVKG
jgi:hypothetical protein